MDEAVTIVSPGAVITFTAVSASAVLPNCSAGNAAKYVRLVSTQPCYVRITNGAGTAVAGDLMVQPADAVIIRSLGLTHINAVQVVAGGILQISPLENQ